MCYGMEVNKGTVKKYEITQKDYDILFASNIIDSIQNITDTLVDLFEDSVFYKQDDIKKVSGFLEMSCHNTSDYREKFLIKQLLDCFDTALNRNTAVFLFF